jgi:hypothetical protein
MPFIINGKMVGLAYERAYRYCSGHMDFVKCDDTENNICPVCGAQLRMKPRKKSNHPELQDKDSMPKMNEKITDKTRLTW